MPSTAPTSAIRSSTAASRCAGAELRVLAPPLELVEDRVLRFLLPVEEEHVLAQRRTARRRGSMLCAVVRLREELDVAGQREHRPGGLAEHERWRRRWAAAGSGSPAGMPSAVSRSMRRNSSWCLSSSSVKRTSASSATWSPKPVVAAHLEHLGADEALDQAEHVGVGAALDLAQQAPLVGAQERRARRRSDRPSGRNLLREVEAAAADHVAVDVPADALGGFDACARSGRVGGDGERLVRFAWRSSS